MLNISYPFRKLLTITQSGNDLLPDHQVCLNIPYMVGMQSTFTDLCFEDVFGRHCPHWVESYEYGVSAKAWVRVPLVGKNTQLFLKYGNPVVNLSNSDATFLLFDDFPGNSLNSDKWSEVSGSNITVQNSKLILNKTSSNVSGVRATSPVFSNEVEFEIKYSTYTAIKYSFYFSLRNSLAGSSGVIVYHETTGGRKLWIMDTSGNYAQSNINTPPEGPLTFRIKRNTSSGAVRVYYDDSLILSKTVDSYRNSPIYFGMEYGDSADSATGTAEIDSIIARSSTDSTFELAEVQDSPERRLWYFEEPPPQEHNLHITGSSHLLQFFPVRIYIPESINVSNWDKLDFYQGEDQLAYWYDEGRYVWVRVLEIPTQGADITMIVGQTGDQDPEKVFSDFEEHETPFQLGPAEGDDVYYLQRQVSVQHCIRVRLTALSSVIKFDVGFASNLTYTHLGYHFDSNNSTLYGFYTSPPWSRFDSQGSLVSAEDMVGYVEFEVKNETIRAKCGGGQWSTSSGSSLINSSAYLSTVGNDNWVKFDQVLVYKTVSGKKPVGYFYIGTKDCGFSLINSLALSKECEFSLINSPTLNKDCGFALSAIVPESDFRECAFTLIKPITAAKTQAYNLVCARDMSKSCGFEITSAQYSNLIACSFSLVGEAPVKSKNAAFQLTRQVIHKPLELRLIATSSASKSSGFSLAESLAIDEFGATVSFTEVTSSCQPILVSAITKNAGFAFGVPSVEVPELELFTSATEVPVSVVIHLHKASTKSAGFAFEDAKWVILVNTSLQISPKALESNAAAILHKERNKDSGFEIDEIIPVQLNSVTINNSEVWTTALRFVVVPGLGSGGDAHRLSKKLSFAIEHDTPYDDTSEEYFSRINGYLHPYDFSPVKHKHDDFYPTKNEVVSTYALDTTKVIAGDTIVPADRGGSAFQLVVITSDNLASWQSGSRQLSWTFRWEHLGLGFGPIGLTSNVTKASYTLDLKTFMRLYLAIVQGNLAQASSDVQNIWATYFDQVAYFYKHGTLDGHPGGDYSATWNLTVWNSAGAANNAWNTPANRGYLYTSRWDPHRFDLFFYRKHPAYLVADYHVKLPAIGGKTPKVVTAVAFPGGEVPSSMDISTMVSSDYTGQSLMGRSIISRAHTGFSIRGINGDTVIVRSFGKPFYIVALITFDNTFDTIDEWDTSPDRFLKGTKELKSSHTRVAASFSIKPWLVG